MRGHLFYNQGLSINRALTFPCHSTMLSGLSEFPTSHFFIQFSFLEYIQLNFRKWFKNGLKVHKRVCHKSTARKSVRR